MIFRSKSGWGAEAAFFVLVLLTLFIPMVFPFTALCVAAPLLWLFTEGHWRRAMVMITGAMLLSLLSNIWVILWLFFLAAAVFSFLLGKGLRQREVGHYAVNATLVWIVFILLLLVIAKWAGINIISLFTHAMVQGVRASPLLQTLESIPNNAQGSAMIVQMVQLVLPGSIVILAVIMTLSNLTVVRFTQTLLRPDTQPVMRYFRLPRSIGLAYVIIVAGVLLGLGSSTGIVSLLVNTAFLLVTFLLSLQATAVLWWIVREKVKAVPVTLLAVIAAFCTLFIVIVFEEIFVLFGLVDVVLDIRKRMSGSNVK